MDDEKLDRIGHKYQQIAQLAHDMIPEEWERVYICGEMEEGGETIFFYYVPKGGRDSIYSLDIAGLFQIDEDEYEGMEDQLFQTMEDLWNEFKYSKQEPWSTFTMTFDKSGKFDVKHGYEDLSKSGPFQRLLAFKYKYLGIVPTDDYAKTVLHEYLKGE
ncbi:immunity protein YezG family protein [Salinithrix halophila]|uniref:Immunity protein YezG family protein n=1 Tax=Salinithrix halophila TaxID=1485204 RepID=A0ABV8JEH7_9BACL